MDDPFREKQFDKETPTPSGPSVCPRTIKFPISDELYDTAFLIAQKEGRCSISLLQRRLQTGHTRTSRIMDQLAAAGVLGLMPPDSCVRPFVRKEPS